MCIYIKREKEHKGIELNVSRDFLCIVIMGDIFISSYAFTFSKCLTMHMYHSFSSKKSILRNCKRKMVGTALSNTFKNVNE